MPSTVALAGVDDERNTGNMARSVLLKLVISFLLIQGVICYAIKAHVLIYTAREVFTGCGYGGVQGYLLSGSVAAPIGFLLSLVGAFCDEELGRVEPKVCRVRYAVSVLLLTLGFYYLAVFLLTLYLWFNARDAETQLPFYSEFFVGLSSNCTSGENLHNLQLAVGVFTLENFIILLQLILCCPCICLYG